MGKIWSKMIGAQTSNNTNPRLSTRHNSSRQPLLSNRQRRVSWNLNNDVSPRSSSPNKFTPIQSSFNESSAIQAPKSAGLAGPDFSMSNMSSSSFSSSYSEF